MRQVPREAEPSARTAKPLPHTTPWYVRLDAMLRQRDISAGFQVLDSMEPAWQDLRVSGRTAADLLLTLAQWVDVGYRNAHFLRAKLDLLPNPKRLNLAVSAYVRLQLAEAFYSLSMDDPDRAIATLEIALRLDDHLLEPSLKLLAHLWKGRAHRKKADYVLAFTHIDAARALAVELPNSAVILAVIQVQHGWLIFQRGDTTQALNIFSQAEAVLNKTDHYIARGNIESARGRIVRRNGDYVKALHHFHQAVSFYGINHPDHPNLARAVTNLAFVKRLLALQLRKHIDSAVTRRSGTSRNVRTGPLQKQHQELYRSAVEELERAKRICVLHEHHSGLTAALLTAGHLHLDVGDLDAAAREAGEALAIAESTHSAVYTARASILSGLIANAHVEELLGHPEDAPAFARRARQFCVDAIALAETTQNKRVLLNAHLALGEVATNNFFNDFDLGRRCAEIAGTLISAEDADYVVDEFNALKSKLLRNVGIDDTLRAWSQGILDGKTLQQVTEEFAELVVTQIWNREERKISRVATQLSMSPKKVRRLIRHAAQAVTSS